MHETGRAAAAAAALGHDARHAVPQGDFHHGGADLGVDGMGGAVVLDVGDLDQEKQAKETARRPAATRSTCISTMRSRKAAFTA